MTPKAMAVLVTALVLLAIAFVKLTGLSIDVWGGAKVFIDGHVCVTKERGIVYKVPWPLATHEVVQKIAFSKANVVLRFESGAKILILRRVPNCSGKRPSYISGRQSVDGALIQQWTLGGEGTFGLQRWRMGGGQAYVVHLPSGKAVPIPKIDRLAEVDAFILVDKQLLVITNALRGEPNTVAFHYGDNIEHRYEIDWQRIFKLEDYGEYSLKPLISIQH